MDVLNASELARMIDHTLLKPQATEMEIRTLCCEAEEFGFATVCLNPTWVSLAATLLHHTPVKVCTVVGFPLGATPAQVKAFEADHYVTLGATELDMVINIGALKSQHYDVVEEDIALVARVAHSASAVLKVIIETALLTQDEKVKACTLAQRAGADFVKTSTGFGPGGATVEDVALMRRAVGHAMGVKAAGGIKTAEDALAVIRAGASRIGASAGVKIIESIRNDS